MPPRRTRTAPPPTEDAAPDGDQPTQATVIEIPSPNLLRLEVEIVGETPLITHRWSERAIEEIEGKQQRTSARAAKEPRNPEAEWRSGLYELPDKKGKYGVLGAGIKKCLITAGMRFTDEHGTVLRGVLSIPNRLYEIRESTPQMRRDMGRLKNSTANVIYRPEFPLPWSVVVPVTYNASMIGQMQVLNLFAVAGFSIGLGDWRPEKNGDFGQFRVGRVKVGA